MKINVQMTDEIARGAYSNMAAINHSLTEFVLDFMYIQPQVNKASVNARILLHPMQAKRLMMVLQQHIALFEKRFGEIQLQAPPVREEDLLH